MSRAFDAKAAAQKAYPERCEDGVVLLLDYLDISAKDFEYEMGMTAEEYIYGTKEAAPQSANPNE